MVGIRYRSSLLNHTCVWPFCSGRILHSVSELYATTALVGAGSYMAMFKLGAPTGARVFTGVASAMALRYAAVKYDLKLPVWDPEVREGKILRRQASTVPVKSG